MSEVRVPFDNENLSDQATLLLAAAEEAEASFGVVRTVAGAFMVPEDIAKSAGVKYDAPEKSETEEVEEKPTPAKKAPAKKAAAKKTAASKDKE